MEVAFVMLGIKSAISQADNWPTVAYGVILLVGYCIGNKDRWGRFSWFLRFLRFPRCLRLQVVILACAAVGPSCTT